MRRMPISVVATALGTFVAGAVIAYPLASNSSSAPAAAIPSVPPADSGDLQLAHMLPFGDEGAFAAGVAYIDDLEARRAAAAAGEGGSAAAEPRLVPAPETSLAVPPLDPAPLPVVDPCADDPESADCPSGISGTVLAIVMPGPLQTYLLPDPPTPGDAFSYVYPECEPVPLEPGYVQIGVGTNRPVSGEISWALHPADGTGIPADAWVSQSTATTASEEASYNAWLADPASLADDSRGWIDHCVVIGPLEPGTYSLESHVQAKDDDSQTSSDATTLVVASADADSHHRRATITYGYGPDILYSDAPHPADQRIVVQAIREGPGVTCDTGGDNDVIVHPTAHGRIGGTSLAVFPIPDYRRARPDYPYLLDDDKRTLSRLDLEAGTSYITCVFWVSDGPSFDDVVVEAAEQSRVTTPDAWTPTLTLLALRDLPRGATSFSLDIDREACDAHTGLTGFSGDTRTHNVNSVLCTMSDHLGDVYGDGGVRVRQSLTLDSGEVYTNVGVIPVDVMCETDTYCDAPENQSGVLPMPKIPVTASVCRSGDGTDCEGDSPTLSFGYSFFQIDYNADEARGGGWTIEAPAAFADADTVPGNVPRLDVAWEPTTSASGTVGIDFVVEADQPVSVQIDLFSADAGDPCLHSGSGADGSLELTTRHEVTITGLCLGTNYLARVTAHNADGTHSVIIVDGYSYRDTIPVNTRPLTVEIQATMLWDTEAYPYTFGPEDVYYLVYAEPRALTVSQASVDGLPRGASLDWQVSRELNDRVDPFHHFPNSSRHICYSGPEDGVFAFPTDATPVPLGDGPVTLNASILIDDVERGCVGRGIGPRFQLTATVTLDQLLEGVELTSDEAPLGMIVRAHVVDGA